MEKDYQKIMSVNEEMLPYDDILPSATGVFNPWIRQLPGIFRGLHLKENMKILDIPCGEGGVSIPLAAKYGARIFGYDIKPKFIERAKNIAKKREVSQRCTFGVKDIRKVIEAKNKYDLILWIAPPHIWRDFGETLKAFETICKKRAKVFIGDAYLNKNAYKKYYPEYQTMSEIEADIESSNFVLDKFYDYENRLWEKDYSRERKRLLKILEKYRDDKKAFNIIQRQINRLNQDEKSDSKMMGTAIWILQLGDQS